MCRKGENIRKRKDGRWEARYIYAFKEDGSPVIRREKSTTVPSMAKHMAK